MNFLNITAILVALLIGIPCGLGLILAAEKVAAKTKEPISMQTNFILLVFLAGITAIYGITVAFLLMGSA